MSALRKEAVELQNYGQEKEYSPKKSIKRKKKNNHFIESFKNSAMIAITFILGILIVYNYAMITDKQMELNNLGIEIRNLNDEIDRHNIALESIKNTNSIEEMAKVCSNRASPHKLTSFGEVSQISGGSAWVLVR